MRLNVKYMCQVDNESGYGYRECCMTSNAMMAEYLTQGRLTREANGRQPEDRYGDYLAPYGDTTDHSANTSTLKDLGIDSYWSYTLSREDVLKSLNAGIPVVVGVAYKSSGHILLIIGYEDTTFIVHDPYGLRNGSTDEYITIGSGGDSDRYSFTLMDAILFDGGPNSGWGRIVTAINGKSTGMRLGL